MQVINYINTFTKIIDAMDKTYLDTLNKRKVELQKELDNINGILQLYPDEQNKVIRSEKTNNFGKSTDKQPTIKESVISIIENHGGKIDVSELSTELGKLFPGKEIKVYKNQARNYLHILKNDKRLRSEKIGDNKWIYHLNK